MDGLISAIPMIISFLDGFPMINLYILKDRNPFSASFSESIETWNSLSFPTAQGLRQLRQGLVVRIETAGAPWKHDLQVVKNPSKNSGESGVSTVLSEVVECYI